MVKDENDLTEDDVKEWFRERKKIFSENKIRMKVKDESFSKNDAPARASWVAMFSSAMYYWLEEIYDLMEELYLELEKTKRTTSKPDFDTMKKRLTEHEIKLKRIDSVFAKTDKWLKNGK